jgi:hypothetical protein
MTDDGSVTADSENTTRKAENMRRFFLTAVLGGLVAAGFGGLNGAARAGGVNVTRVGAYGTDSYTRFFRAGDLVRVAISGDGDTDLDLYVYCPCGQVIARDDDNTDDCLVQFRAPESGVYTIKVVNRGAVYNEYVIGVND